MADFSNDIKRYLNGEMTPAERHALEKKALSDPFLADALEGAEQLTASEWKEDVNALHQKIEAHINGSKGGSNGSWVWPLRFAAALLLITVSMFIVYKWNSPSPEESPLALAEKLESTTPNELDETIAIDSPSQRSISSPREIESPKTESQAGAGASESPVLPKEEVGKTTPEIAQAGELIAHAEPEAVTDDVVEEPLQIVDKAKDERATEIATAKKITIEPERKTAARAAAPSSQVPSNTIKGKVTSAEDGSPLPGVNVVIKGTTIGTVTDVTGNYTIENAGPTSTLTYSFIGLQSKDVPTDGKRTLDVEMNTDVSQLSEVVVTGYGYSEKSESTSTVDLAHPTIGNKAFKKYLEENLRYPKAAMENKTEGRVTVEFFVEVNGSLSELRIIRGIGSGCDEELIRLIKEGPAWEPTKKNNIAIRDKARVRLKFDLPKD